MTADETDLQRETQVAIAIDRVVSRLWDDEPAQQRGRSAIGHFLNALDNQGFVIVPKSDHLSKKELRSEGYRVVKWSHVAERIIDEIDLSDGSGE